MPDHIPDPAGDPVDRLRSLSRTGRPMPALPAEEVRRRGDRRRRRTQAMAAAATLVVVGVIGTGGVALGGMLADRGGPAPAGSPTPAPAVTELRTDVPDDFPIEAGLEVIEGGASDTALSASSITVCDEEVGLATDDDVVASASTGAGGMGDSAVYARSVATFPDVDAAAAFVDDVRTAVDGCTFSAGESRTTATLDDVLTRNAEAAAPLDETLEVRAWGAEATPEGDAPGATSLRVYRVANAVLVSRTIDPTAGEAELDALTLDGFELEQSAVLAMRYYAGQDLPSYSGADPVDPDGGDGGEPSTPAASVAPGQVLTVDDLPAPPERSEEWAAIEPSDEPTLACEPQRLQVLGFADARYAEFTAPIAEEPGTTPDPDAPVLRDSAINTAVLAFDSRAEADAAYGTVTSWISTCDAPVGGQDITVEDREPQVVVPDGSEGYWWATSYTAPEACPDSDCDAIWFDHQGAALVGTYVVLVSYRDLAGPVELEGMDDRMNAIFTAAVANAAYGLEG